MLTYRNNPDLKQSFITRFAAHRAADAVVQGLGFSNGRGCFIGCTMNEYNHEAFASRIAPEWLARWADRVFEGLPIQDAPQFGSDLLEAIPVGMNIEKVMWQLALLRQEKGLISLEGNTALYAVKCREAIANVIEHCKLGGEQVSLKESASDLADSAAESAWIAAGSEESEGPEWSVARSAALSAESAAWSTRSVEWAEAESAARSSDRRQPTTAGSPSTSSSRSGLGYALVRPADRPG